MAYHTSGLDLSLTINHSCSLSALLYFTSTTKSVRIIIYLTFLVIQQQQFPFALCLVTSSNTCIYNRLLLSPHCNQCFHASICRKHHLPGSFGCIPGRQYTEQTDRYTTGHDRSSCYDLCTFSCHQGKLLNQHALVLVLLREYLKRTQIKNTVSFSAVQMSGVKY